MGENLTIADVLERAADLIEPEGAWTQNAFARDATGKSTGLSGMASAVCFCVVGATEMVAGEVAPMLSCRADNFLQKVLGVDSASHWNDAPERTQAEVVAKLREAAALAREQGK